MVNDPRRLEYYKKCRQIRITVLALLVSLTIIAPFFVSRLDSLILFGFPIGFYLTAQGAIILCIAIVFWFVTRQSRADREFGVIDDY